MSMSSDVRLDKYVISINNALFELMCENYDKHCSEKILDILSHSEYSIDPNYIDELYSKKIPLFTDIYDRIALVEKLCCGGKLDTSVIYLYELYAQYNNDDNIINLIDNVTNNIFLCNQFAENEIIKIIEYINSNDTKNMKLITMIINNIISYNFHSDQLYKQIKKIFEYLISVNLIESSKILLLKLIIIYIDQLKPEIMLSYESNKLAEILSGCHNNILMILYEKFDCTYNQINIIEKMNLHDTIKLTDDLIQKKKQKDEILQCKYPDTFERDDIIHSFQYIDKEIYSKYMSKNKSLLKYFIHLDNYTDLSLVESMRLFLNKIVLPKESQDIVHILEIFTEHYENCNNMNYSDSLIFHLTCATLMLNTDLHNANVLHKISLKKFILNWYKNIDTKRTIPKKMLTNIYREIYGNQFKFINL